MNKLVYCIIVFLFFAGASLAQDKTEGAPISVEISSKYLAPQQEYTLSGQTETGNMSLNIKVEILSRSSVLETEDVATEITGKYQITRKAPADKGIYQAKVTGADGKLSDTASFVVVSPVGVSKALAQHFDKPVMLAQKGLEAANIIVSRMPPSAARQEFKGKYIEVAAQLAEMNEQLREMKANFVKLMDIAADKPEVMGEVDTYIPQLGSQLGEMEMKAAEFSWKLSAGSQDLASTCDNLDFAIEALGFASALLNIQMSIIGTIDNSIKSMLRSKVVDATIEDKDFNAAAEIALNGAARMANPITFSLGLLIDLSQHLAQKMYDQFCEELKGPFTGKFFAEFEAGDAQGVWERYSIGMKGELVLRYGKTGNSKTGFTVSGEFKGAYTDYDFWTDILRVEPLPKDVYILYQKVLNPVSSYSAERQVTFGRAETIIPGNFRVKVKGVVKDEKLLLKFDDKALINQLGTTESFRLIVVATNPIVLIPQVKVFKFPVAPARSIFIVAMGEEGQEFEFKDSRGYSYEQSKMENVGRRITTKKTIENMRNLSNDEIRLKTTLDIRLETKDHYEE